MVVERTRHTQNTAIFWHRQVTMARCSSGGNRMDSGMSTGRIAGICLTCFPGRKCSTSPSTQPRSISCRGHRTKQDVFWHVPPPMERFQSSNSKTIAGSTRFFRPMDLAPMPSRGHRPRDQGVWSAAPHQPRRFVGLSRAAVTILSRFGTGSR